MSSQERGLGKHRHLYLVQYLHPNQKKKKKSKRLVFFFFSYIGNYTERINNQLQHNLFLKKFSKSYLQRGNNLFTKSFQFCSKI